MKKVIFGIVSVMLLSAGCGTMAPQPDPNQPNSKTQSEPAQLTPTPNQQNNSPDTPNKQNLVLYTPDDFARNDAYISSHAALSSGSFNDWFITIDSMVSKEAFVKQTLTGNPFGYTTIDQAWPKLAEFYITELYPSPKTCSGKGFIKETFEGKDYAVDYCATDNNHAFGIRWVKNNNGNWLIVGISLAEKDNQGQITTGGTSFSTAAGSKTDLMTVQNHLKEILQK